MGVPGPTCVSRSLASCASNGNLLFRDSYRRFETTLFRTSSANRNASRTEREYSRLPSSVNDTKQDRRRCAVRPAGLSSPHEHGSSLWIRQRRSGRHAPGCRAGIGRDARAGLRRHPRQDGRRARGRGRADVGRHRLRQPRGAGTRARSGGGQGRPRLPRGRRQPAVPRRHPRHDARRPARPAPRHEPSRRPHRLSRPAHHRPRTRRVGRTARRWRQPVAPASRAERRGGSNAALSSHRGAGEAPGVRGCTTTRRWA